MRALILPSLKIEERPDPEPGAEEILVRVGAAALNRADLSQRAGKYPAPPGWPEDIAGLEYAGEVIRAMSMEGRMTVCNMSIEAGARAGLVAPDETTYRYLTGRPMG